jgi:hypothetical protein
MLILLLALLLGTAGRADAQVGRFVPYGPPRGALLDLVAGPRRPALPRAEESGVYASRDGGRTWAWSGAGMGNQAVRALAALAAGPTRGTSLRRGLASRGRGRSRRGTLGEARSAGLRGHPAFILFADPRHRRLEVDSVGFFAIAAP